MLYSRNDLAVTECRALFPFEYQRLDAMEDVIAACSDNYFTELAKYYDVTHQWRDYDLQASFLQEVIQKYRQDCRRVLDLACGTGEHAHRLSRAGYRVTGIDDSKEMLAIASSKSPGSSPAPQWLLSDFMTLESLERFDVAYCLGMTIHYVYSPDKLARFLSQVKERLRPAGIFIMDIINPWRILDWAPANHFCSTDPSHQIYILERSEMDRVSRIRHNDYTWFVGDLDGPWQRHKLFENLKMWFVDEIERFLTETGFRVIATCSDYSTGRLDLEKGFNVVFVAERR